VKYSAKFIKDVKEAFPDDPRLAGDLEKGYLTVKVALEAESQMSITPGEIVRAFDTGNEKAIYDKAKKKVHAKELYERWEKIFADYLKKNGLTETEAWMEERDNSYIEVRKAERAKK